MRWFKHMASSADDEKLSQLKDAHGLEGYGFWWSVVEIVASKVGEDAGTSAEFSAKKWGNLLGISPKKFQNLAKFCANLGLFSIKFEQNLILIDMPNILKFRDEYTERKHKKSGQHRDKLRPSRAHGTEADTEADTEAELNTYSASASHDAVSAEESSSAESEERLEKNTEETVYITKKKRKLTGKRLESFNAFWEAFEHAKGKAEAADAWLDIPKLTNSLVEKIIAAAEVEAAARPQLVAAGKSPKWAQGWLSGRRWEDESLCETTKTLDDLLAERGITQ